MTKTAFLIEPYMGGSHASWANDLQRFFPYFKIFSLPPQGWKWRMEGGAVALAAQVNKERFLPDFFLVTDMLNVPLFRQLIEKRFREIPCYLYFHENQLTYPWSPRDNGRSLARVHHFGFINFMSALVSDKVFFNSNYHFKAFYKAVARMLKSFPDHQCLENIQVCKEKSFLLPIGLNLLERKTVKVVNTAPVITWNHRWEHDKRPELFLKLLRFLRSQDCSFRLQILGELPRSSSSIFDILTEEFSHKIIHLGYAEDSEEYWKLLYNTDFYPVTSEHDFFGISTCEAIFCGAYPLLPRGLAYEDHWPAEQFSKYYYQSEDELFRKSLAYLQGPSTPSVELSQAVEQYRWKNLLGIYNKSFEWCQAPGVLRNKES